LIVSSINAYNLWSEHWEHVAHDIPIEEKPEYPYQNIRSKNYFWGDGDKTLLYEGPIPICFNLVFNYNTVLRIILLTSYFPINSWNDSVNYHKQD